MVAKGYQGLRRAGQRDGQMTGQGEGATRSATSGNAGHPSSSKQPMLYICKKGGNKKGPFIQSFQSFWDIFCHLISRLASFANH